MEHRQQRANALFDVGVMEQCAGMARNSHADRSTAPPMKPGMCFEFVSPESCPHLKNLFPAVAPPGMDSGCHGLLLITASAHLPSAPVVHLGGAPSSPGPAAELLERIRTMESPYGDFWDCAVTAMILHLLADTEFKVR